MLCWGNASYGQLGLGGIDEEIVVEPRRCDFFHGKRVSDIGCGRKHTAFLLDDGTVYTCGCNDLGQLGHDKSRKKPEQVVALDAQIIVALSCGESHTLALNDKGQVFSWGLGSDGQLGLNNFEECIRVPRNIKSLSDVQVAHVTCGYWHSLALSRGGQIFSWGQNRYGQLGLGLMGQSFSTPQAVQSLQAVPFVQLAAGGAHSFALTVSGAVFGWGRNKFGQLGVNDSNDRCFPTLLKSLRSQRVIYVCCGEDHTAVLTKEGGVFTFGAGGYGQLGHNSTNHEINPRKVFELMGNVVTQISCGRQHTLAFTPACGKIYSFGLGGNGQLGTRATCNRKSPSPVKGPWATSCPSEENDLEQSCLVKRIYAGGDQSFAHYCPINEPQDMDNLTEQDPQRRICTLNEANNCHFDAVLVSFINFFTSVLATLVVFAVLGFKANIMNSKCVALNTNKIVALLGSDIDQSLIPHHINLTQVSQVTAEDYHQMIQIIKGVKEDEYPKLGLESCSIEDELNQAVQGTGLAFIAFTEAMTHFPASPFWSVMFFLMLINLGLGSMFGTIEGILTPLIDTFKVRKEFLTVGCCVLAFSIGLLFVQRSGNYFVTMFDDYSATLPLLIVVVLENVAIAWFYGIDKFFEDLKDMLGFTPYRFYYYMWKYITPILLLLLLCASFIQLTMTPPSYSAWIQEEAVEKTLHFPPWGIAVCISLVVMAMMPVPVVFCLRYFNIIDENTSGLSTVAYKKGRVIKESPRPEDDDDASLIHGKTPSEAPSPMPGKSIYRKQSGGGGTEVDTAPNGRYGIGYLMADMPDMPESDL